jgi:hypothetical protein
VETIVTTAVQFTLRDDGILEVEHLPGTGETTADLVPEQIEAVRRLVGDTPRPALWKIHKTPMADLAAWREWLQVGAHFGVAVAIMHDEERDGPLPPLVAATASFMFPIKTFTDEAEAVEWLTGFLKPAD